MEESNYSVEISYVIEISEISQVKDYWGYTVRETTPFASHTYYYHSTNLKRLTSHRSKIVESYKKKKSELDKNSFWKGERIR